MPDETSDDTSNPTTGELFVQLTGQTTITDPQQQGVSERVIDATDSDASTTAGNVAAAMRATGLADTIDNPKPD